MSVDSRGWGRVGALTEPSGPLLGVDLLTAGLPHVAALPEGVESLHDGLVLADDFVDPLLQRLGVDRRGRRGLGLLLGRLPELEPLHQPHVPGLLVGREGEGLAGVTHRETISSLLTREVATWLPDMLTRMFPRMVSRMITINFTGMITRMITGMIMRMVCWLVHNVVAVDKR